MLKPLASVCWRWGGGVEVARCDVFCRGKTIFVNCGNETLQNMFSGPTISSEKRGSNAGF